MVKVPQLAWYDPNELILPLPETWEVEVCNMAGYNRPALTPNAIEAAVKSPIGISRIRELAKLKKEVVIIFDDMTRITPVSAIVPFVLEELREAAIPDSSIRLIMALGCHGARDSRDFAKKLGGNIAKRFPIYNHNPFANCTHVGRTATHGTDLYVNEEVMKCDLKIGIGSVVPHPAGGFGGGGKIILPGVTSLETTKQYHEMLYKFTSQGSESKVGIGIVQDNPGRIDIDEAATLVGLDVLINCVVNMWGQIVVIFVGDMKSAYSAAVEEAKTVYVTQRVHEKDIVFANSFAKANEAFIGLEIAHRAVKSEGGSIVLIANTPEGQVVHYLYSAFGNSIHGPLRYAPHQARSLKNLIVFSEYRDLASWPWFGDKRKVKFLHKWDTVLSVLQKAYSKDSKVAVFPNADIQYFLSGLAD